MDLHSWVRSEGRGALSRLQLRTGLAYTTILRLYHGDGDASVKTLRLVEAATEGAVTVPELLAKRTGLTVERGPKVVHE